jgi:2-polyprenyl-6-methoxyphenol hydroxylase-like FAD-dependent oxidoreductase
LTLAAALAQLAPRTDVEVYEQDAAAAERRRGYAIGLKAAALAVLERLGLRDEVLAGGAQQVTNFMITDREGNTLLALPSGNGQHQTRPTACSVIIFSQSSLAPCRPTECSTDSRRSAMSRSKGNSG